MNDDWNDSKGLFQTIEPTWHFPGHFTWGTVDYKCSCGKVFTSLGKLLRHVKRKNR